MKKKQNCECKRVRTERINSVVHCVCVTVCTCVYKHIYPYSYILYTIHISHPKNKKFKTVYNTKKRSSNQTKKQPASNNNKIIQYLHLIDGCWYSRNWSCVAHSSSSRSRCNDRSSKKFSTCMYNLCAERHQKSSNKEGKKRINGTSISSQIEWK